MIDKQLRAFPPPQPPFSNRKSSAPALSSPLISMTMAVCLPVIPGPAGHSFVSRCDYHSQLLSNPSPGKSRSGPYMCFTDGTRGESEPPFFPPHPVPLRSAFVWVFSLVRLRRDFARGKPRGIKLAARVCVLFQNGTDRGAHPLGVHGGRREAAPAVRLRGPHTGLPGSFPCLRPLGSLPRRDAFSRVPRLHESPLPSNPPIC